MPLAVLSDRPLVESTMAPPPPPNLHSWIGVLPLPLDALLEILLLLPAKDLYRLRAVSRSWRSLLSGPDFIAAHAARHPQPLIVTGYYLGRYHHDYPNRGIICDIMDLSGHVVRRVRATPEAERVMSIQLDLISVSVGHGFRGSYQLLNPATGDALPLPKGHAPLKRPMIDNQTFLAFGKVASAGEYKVLRVIGNASDYEDPMQWYEVCTPGGSNSSVWRAKKLPRDIVDLDLWKNVVVGEIVYFLLCAGPHIFV